MPADIKNFTKEWIQFLKNNQIVALQSDPKTGKLTYKKKVTSDLLTKFLKNRTDLDDEVIANAIRQATSKPGGGKQAFSNMAQQLAPKATNHGGQKSGEISDTPDAIRKRNARSQGGQAFSQMGKTLTSKPTLHEEFIDKPIEMTEEDVEEVFALLQPHLSGTKTAPTSPTAEVEPKEQLDQIKSIIDRMSPEQRKDMWTALNDTTLTEKTLEKSNIEDMFRAASKIKAVTFDTINQEWKKTGYKTDSEDIKKILKGLGYGDDEIDKVFASVFSDTEDDSPGPAPGRSKGIAIIMDHVKKAGLKDELIAFMQEKYGEELNKPPEPEDKGWAGKTGDLWNKGLEKVSGFVNSRLREMTYPQIEQVFKAILLEERTGLKERETRNLGRGRKST